jgi:hypothetical protein
MTVAALLDASRRLRSLVKGHGAEPQHERIEVADDPGHIRQTACESTSSYWPEAQGFCSVHLTILRTEYRHPNLVMPRGRLWWRSRGRTGVFSASAFIASAIQQHELALETADHDFGCITVSATLTGPFACSQ